MYCHGDFIYKNKIDNRITINIIPIGKGQLKISVREPKFGNIDVNFDQKCARRLRGIAISFSGIDISCRLSDDHFSLISNNLAIFL